MDRAHRLIEPYVGKEGVIGIYMVGSATRPYRDGLSDYDIEVIVEDDVYERTPDDERQVFSFKEGDERVVDYEFYLWPWSGFTGLAGSTQDMFHQPYQNAVILYDPEGRIAPVIRGQAQLDEGVRLDRMRVHYLEFRFRLGRARKTANRDASRRLNLGLLYGDAQRALVKLLFLVKRSWISMGHWTEQELGELGVPTELVEAIVPTFENPVSDAVRGLVERVDAWLTAEGETFHTDPAALNTWAFHRSEGKAAFERWGGR